VGRSGWVVIDDDLQFPTRKDSDPATGATVPGRGQSLQGGSDMTSQHHKTKPASAELLGSIPDALTGSRDTNRRGDHR
jgi:hypothetical protein